MREGWKYARLRELCEIRNGLWKGKKPPFQKVGVIRNTNFTKDGKLNDSNIAYIEVEKSQFEKRRLKYGDIIIEKSGGGPKQPVGRAIIFNKQDGEYSFSNFTSSLRVRDDKRCDFEYLHLYLYYIYEIGVTESMQKHSTGIRNLKFDEYKDIQIPLPPLAEQKQIVAILDKAFDAIDKAKANAEQNLKNARELFESYLNGVFEKKGEGWEEKRMDEICEITSKLIDPRLQEYQDLIHIGAGNIESKTGKLLELKTAKEEKLISGKFLFDNSMVLYSKIRPYLIKVVRCESIGLCSADIYPLSPKESVTKDFLYYLLLSQDFTEYAILGSQRAGMPKVNRNHLFSYKTFIPPLKDQYRIISQLDFIYSESKKLESIFNNKLEDLEILKKSLLQKAFSGELTTIKESVASEAETGDKLFDC